MTAGTKLTQEEFLERSTAQHDDRYDYSLSDYQSNNIDVVIVCREHGEFPQRPQRHWSGAGCPICYTTWKKANLHADRRSNIAGEIPRRYWKQCIKHAHARGREITITADEVWSLYLKQNGKCALTGVPIGFRDDGSGRCHTASLDRIDSTKGYVSGNVQWVDKAVNALKHGFEESEFIALCILVADHFRDQHG